MEKFKNQKGVTLTSLIIYIVAMVIVVGIIATITKYYYSNLSDINSQVDASKEYASLNSYLSQDVNNPYNIIQECSEDHILFYNSANENEGYNQYTFKSGSIYYNKIKICNGVRNCEFIQDVDEPQIKFTLNITFKNNESKSVNYSIKRDPNISLAGTVMGYAKNAMPKGAKILEGTNEQTGIVMVDNNGNEWTWVSIPEKVFTTAKSNTDYDNIKADLIAYATDYREGKTGQGRYWTDEWYAKDGNNYISASTEGLTDTQKLLDNGCGLNYNDYNTAYQKMLASIYTNKGFYISRYEIGDSTATASNTTRTSSTETSNTPVSNVNQIPYNYVTCSEAKKLASKLKTDSKSSSLLFGIQWDLTCKYLEENADWDTTTNTKQYYLKDNSIIWGNYSNNSFTLNRGKYNINPNSSSSIWTVYNVDTTNYVTSSQTSNNTSYYQLLTTGASEGTNKMNIYDLAGNEWEWTLEHAMSDITIPCAFRGGVCDGSGSSTPVAHRSYSYVTGSNDKIGFRAMLYDDDTQDDDTEEEPSVMDNAVAAMPTGATILEGTTAETGIVMVDSNENEWVWIDIPSKVFTRAQNDTDYDNIKLDLITYATDYREGKAGQGLNWTDEWYAKDGSTVITASTNELTDAQKLLDNGCGLNYSDYNTAYQNMLSSVYTNKGFYISRYEIGDKESTQSNTTRATSTGTSNTPVSKVDKIPYNFVTCSQAQGLASSMKTGTKNASLLFGIQWDLVCKYLEENVNWDTTTNTKQYYLKSNSMSWGNYKNQSLTLKSGKYNTNPNYYASVWTAYNVDTTNYVTSSQTSSNTSYSQLLTTGASEGTNKMNIYDLAGNQSEWTLEYAKINQPCAYRGGDFSGAGGDNPAAYRNSTAITTSNRIIAFRSSLY